MKSVSASIYFLSQRFAHVALEKVIDDQHQEYNNNDDKASPPIVDRPTQLICISDKYKRQSATSSPPRPQNERQRNFTEEFSLQISISQFEEAQPKKAKTIWFSSALVQVRDGFWILS